MAPGCVGHKFDIQSKFSISTRIDISINKPHKSELGPQLTELKSELDSLVIKSCAAPPHRCRKEVGLRDSENWRQTGPLNSRRERRLAQIVAQAPRRFVGCKWLPATGAVSPTRYPSGIHRSTYHMKRKKVTQNDH